MQPPDRSQRLQDDLKVASDRLKKRYAGRVEDRVVDGVVAALAGEFADARIMDFVGLLVDRRGAHMLESMLVMA